MSNVARKLTILMVLFFLMGMAVLLPRPDRAAVAQEAATPIVESCVDPTLQGTLGGINVRSGPGLIYPIIGSIPGTETFSIVGRAGFAEWWLIQLEDEETGWVSNNVVTVSGNAGAAPIVDAPTLADGTTPTPGQAWILGTTTFCASALEVVETPEVGTIGEWNLPRNLSLSGATSDPRMAIDSNGLFHMIWRDEVDGFVYVQGNGSDWTVPRVVELPFGTRIYYPDLSETAATPYLVPTLAADQNGNVHAFWIDDENGLYHSSVPAGEFATFDSWTSRETLGVSALRLDVTVDSNGIFHLAYIRPLDTEDARPGVYYQQSADDGEEWSTATLLYQSRYFHAIAAEATSIDLKTTDIDDITQVFVAWDNRSEGQVWTSHSPDGGLTWNQPKLVDSRQPEDITESVSPSRIAVGALGNEIVLSWQAGHNGETCAHYYVASSDGGETWGPNEIIQQPRGCHLTDQFLVTEDGYIILLALVEEVVGTRGYFLAWNGEEWSDPQEQTVIYGFQNPSTYLEVRLQCHQPMTIGSNELFVIGCDDNAGKDIWSTRRTILDVNEWFASPPVWQLAEVIAAQPQAISSLNLRADSDGLLHALWSRENSAEIFYSIHTSQFWSQPVAILRALEGNATQPVAALDNNGHILATWSGITSGRIYFSSAETSRALAPSDWSPTQVVSEPGLFAQSPRMVVTPAGIIYIIYAIPLNEDRGIYLVRSDDGGETWSPATRIFDGVSADWSIVGPPQLTATSDGRLHMLLTHYQQATDKGPLAVFYSRSDDAGGNWSSPLLMAEQPAFRADILGIGPQQLHRLWFKEGNSGLEVWHDFSSDGGGSWSSATSATGFGQAGKPVAITSDAAGRLHLLGASNDVLHHWIRDNDSWIVEAEASLETDTLGDIYEVGALVASSGEMTVMFAVAGEENALYHTERLLTLPDIPPTPTSEPAQPTPESSPTPAPTETPAPSPTATMLPTPSPSPVSTLPFITGENSILDIAVTVLPVILLVGVAFFFGLRSVRGRR